MNWVTAACSLRALLQCVQFIDSSISGNLTPDPLESKLNEKEDTTTPEYG